MANSYENTIMPENPVEQLKPDAIPVDDKGQPLPDPTENLSGYLAPKGVEELRKAYSEVEVDEDVRKTMEPPQKTGFLRKHKPGKRGYDYYGTPAGSIPNDNNGLKPSPLSELFSEAEALEPDFDIEKIKDHVLNPYPEVEPELKVVETPKLEHSSIENANGADRQIADNILKKPEVVKDPNAPKFLDMYKESTNTRVIYQFDDNQDDNAQPSKNSESAEQIFAGNSDYLNTGKPLSRREERKARKAARKAEKRKAKERRKAEKAQKKAAKKAAKNGVPFDTSVTSPDEIIKLRESRADKAVTETELKVNDENLSKNNMIVKMEKVADEVKDATENVEKEAEIIAEKAESEKQIEEANRLKEEAQLEAKRTAQEAEKRIKEERETLLKEQEEKERAMKDKLDEEKAAAQQAAEEAKSAREEAERLKSELEEMKKAAAQAIAQKQAAEAAAKAALEAKQKDKEKSENQQDDKKEHQTKRTHKSKSEDAQNTETEKIRKERDEAIAKAKAQKEAAVEKAKAEREAAVAKAKAEKAEAIAKVKNNSRKSKTANEKDDALSTEGIKRRIAEMKAQLSAEDSDE